MFCDDLKDKYHFICISQLYKQLRKRYIPEYYFKRPNMHKFIELMSNDDTKTVCNPANFVFNVFLPRKSHMAISTWTVLFNFKCVFLTMYCTVVVFAQGPQAYCLRNYLLKQNGRCNVCTTEPQLVRQRCSKPEVSEDVDIFHE